jgi:nucleotide-binding universal stress UspA family protein
MLPIHTILHPTDFSEHSGSALQMACALARDYRARLIVLHVTVQPTIVYGEGVVPPDPVQVVEEARAYLDRLAIPQGIPVERRLAEGDPPAEILHVAADSGADLIVMGTHGRTGLERLLMGSVAERVVRKAPCPVLTVRTPFVEHVSGGLAAGLPIAASAG